MSRHAERGVSRRPPLNGWIVVVLVVVLVLVLAHTIVLVLVNCAENENDYDHDCHRDDDYDYDDEDEDECDSIPLCRCGLRWQLSPRDENIDSIPFILHTDSKWDIQNKFTIRMTEIQNTRTDSRAAMTSGWTRLECCPLVL